MKRVLLVISLLNIFLPSTPQERFFDHPIKEQLFITGSFGELRSNHFHSGVDIKTKGQVGLPVYAVADGYISRIAVSPVGFGNALYINHPNNTTSVYGHLLKFRDDIDQFVKNNQYQNQNFTVDLQLNETQFKVKKGELIGHSGNSGSSGGPHLHFELRDASTQEPFNPLTREIYVKDEMPPRINAVKIYSLGGNSHVNYSKYSKKYSCVNYNGKYHLKNNPVVPVYGKIGFGVRITDYIDGTWSKCGINSLKLLIDGKEHFSFEIEQFSFSKTRYINSHIDYEEYISGKRHYHKAWLEPGNKLDFYAKEHDDGIFLATDNQKHIIEIIVADSRGNTSSVEFTVSSILWEGGKKDELQANFFRFNEPNTFEQENIKLECPPNAFYSDFEFIYDNKQSSDTDLFSSIHKIHENTVAIHSGINLRVKPNNLPNDLQDKAILVSIDPLTGRKAYAGGKFEDEWVKQRIRSFGNYAVSIDTIPPVIQPLSIRNKNMLSEKNRVRFKIYDSLSGIKDYHGFIDEKWVLFEYDTKNRMITYYFDPTRMEFQKKHTLELLVTDNKNNSTAYTATFFK